nr:hypothetical protein [uncultured archaeon]
MDIRYLGSALHVARVIRRMTQQDVAGFLSVELDKPVALHDIQNIENDAYVFTPELLAAYCKVLRMPEAKILKCAQGIERDSEKSEEELLDELINETEYRIWRIEQQEKNEAEE